MKLQVSQTYPRTVDGLPAPPPLFKPQSSRYLTIPLYLSSAIFSALCLLFYVRRGQYLPHAYALCTRDGSARIYTVDPVTPQVQCLVVQGQTIIDTGSLEDVYRRWDASILALQAAQKRALHKPRLETKFIKSGSIVVPGMSDSHVHMLEYGASRLIPLESASRPEDAVAAVRTFILADEDIRSDPLKFVEGWGWDHTRWPGQEFPSAADLDRDPIVRSRRVVLQGKDGHAIWVNSKVLSEISPLPDHVEGGAIVRDVSGNPTGVLLDNAQSLVQIPPPTQKDLEKQFKLVVDDAVSYGLTSIHDAGFDPKSLEFFKRLADEKRLPIRIYGMTYFDENAEYWGDKIKPIVGAADGRFTARSVKIFGDGALRTGGAALFEPYTDNPDTRGFMRIDPEIMTSFVKRFLHDGWQTNVHAIGDRANSLVIDAFESALEGINVTALRPRLEHAQIIRHVDMTRLAKLGVIASVQPTHAQVDMYFGENRLGPERVKLLYAFRDIIEHGARITLGSDSPVESMNPLHGFFAAVARVAPDGTSPHGPDGWFPEQRLTREEALRGITIDPAYASFTDHILGSISPGKRADYTVLSQDIMTVPAMDILRTEVTATVIDGKPIYGRL
ncbi:amidohydrolase family-domain-containing protein [Amylostereum chailletii]|nr:amidohydrolase family-domain-containing protein [Amylostereum chailletii]